MQILYCRYYIADIILQILYYKYHITNIILHYILFGGIFIKKILFSFTFILLIILSFPAVSAGDMDDNSLSSINKIDLDSDLSSINNLDLDNDLSSIIEDSGEDNQDIQNQEQYISNQESDSQNNQEISLSNENDLILTSESGNIHILGDFNELSYRINKTPDGGILTLNKDYKFSEGSYKGITISKSITIDGAGHTLDGSKSSRIFNITADNVILKNINFINGNALGRYDSLPAGGGAIYWDGDNGFLENCNFSNNTGMGIEDDPYEQETVIVLDNGMEIHQYNIRPMGASTNKGGAIVWNGDNGIVLNCVFKKNSVGYPNAGGAIYWRGDFGKVINSEFNDNDAWIGSAIYWFGSNGTLFSSKVLCEDDLFDSGLSWIGENGTIRNSILIGNNIRDVINYYSDSLAANYNYWGDTAANRTKFNKIANLTCWYVLNTSSKNVSYQNIKKIDSNKFFLVDKNGNLYDDSSIVSPKKNKTSKKDANVKKTTVKKAKIKITSKDLTKYYMNSTQFKVKLFINGKIAKAKVVSFKIKNHTYKVKTNNKGFAILKINQKPGKYSVLTQYNNVKVKNKITVKSTLISKDLTKNIGKTRYFKVKVLNSKGKAFSNQLVKFRFRDHTYKVKTTSNGIAKFRASKKLKKGVYSIKTSCNGLTNSNKIIVK